MIELKLGNPSAASEWFGFVLSLVGLIVWPIVIVTLAVLFRLPIRDFIDRISRFAWGDKIIDVSGTLDKAEGKAAEVNIPSNVVKSPTQSDDLSRFEKLMDLSPAAAITTEWIHVENALKRLAETYDIDQRARNNAAEILRALVRREVVPGPFIGMINELRAVRNGAAHGQNVDATDAIRFRELSQQARTFLDHLIKENEQAVREARGI